MTRFIDEYLPSRVVGYPVRVGPRFSTQLVTVDSGAEQANRRWANPLRSVTIPDGVRDQATFEAVKAHWLIMGGPAHTWPWRDPTDFASVDLSKINHAPTVSGLDQLIGTGDGVQTEFQLTKTYSVGSSSYVRPIKFPIVSSVIVTVNGVDPTVASPSVMWSVTREGGVITFNEPVNMGAPVRAGFLFDLQVRYESDDTFGGIMKTFGVGGFADIPLMEVPFCED